MDKNEATPYAHFYRTTSKITKKQKLAVILNEGGLGDYVARAPAIKWLIETQTHLEVTIWTPGFVVELFQHWFPKHKVRDRRLWHKYKERDMYIVDQTLPQHTTLSSHLVDHGFHVIADVDPTPEWKQYLSISTSEFKSTPLKEPYIVLTPGATSRARTLPGEVWNKIMDAFEGEYNFVVLGRKSLEGQYQADFSDAVDYSRTQDLREKTNLLEAYSIMQGAVAVVGLDNGLMHLAACAPANQPNKPAVPLIWAFSTVRPEHRLPYGRPGIKIIEPPISLNCRFCQSNMKYLVGHDFRTCLYRDYKCLESLRPEMFIKALGEVL